MKIAHVHSYGNSSIKYEVLSLQSVEQLGREKPVRIVLVVWLKNSKQRKGSPRHHRQKQPLHPVAVYALSQDEIIKFMHSFNFPLL